MARDSTPGASVTVYPDGPLVVRGDVELRALDGTVLESGRTIALCRCGRSALKPLCDGSHHNGRRSRTRPDTEQGTCGQTDAH